MASICSVTFIDPNSAPMPAPARPQTTKPVTMGPISWTSENTTAAGSNEPAPNRTRLSRVSRERMAPMAAPAKATRGNDFDPISSICRASSRNSKGGVTAARRTCQEKRPSSPNHSKNPLIRVVLELVVEDMDKNLQPLRKFDELLVLVPLQGTKNLPAGFTP